MAGFSRLTAKTAIDRRGVRLNECARPRSSLCTVPVAARSGHENVAVYRDEGISGSKGRDKRPGFNAMHKDPAGASSISSWLGASIGSAAAYKT